MTNNRFILRFIVYLIYMDYDKKMFLELSIWHLKRFH